MPRALVTQCVGGRYTLITLNDGKTVEAFAKGKLRNTTIEKSSSFHKEKSYRFKKEDIVTKLSPKVGDIVELTLNDNTYFINNIYPRKNDLERPLVSNVDVMVLVFSATQPEFSFNLLDNMLLVVYINKIKPVLVVTKIDLLDTIKLEQLKTKLDYYHQTLNLDIFYTNNFDAKSLPQLTPYFNNTLGVLMGQTGVGKSSLINALFPKLNLKTDEISQALGRGKHTTRVASLYPFHKGFIADTPGFSKVDFSLFYKEELKNYYPDFVKLARTCKYTNQCNHIGEEGCAVIKEVRCGKIITERYDNYLRFFSKIKQQKRRY